MENIVKKVPEEVGARNLFGDKAIGGGPRRSTQMVRDFESCFMPQQ
jgi:hypothetical protein